MNYRGILVLAWLTALAFPAMAEKPGQPRVAVQSNPVSIRDGTTVRESAWTLNAAYNPDTYTVRLAKGERREICFLSGANFCRTLGDGDVVDFVITFKGTDYPTRIVGKVVTPMANFSPAYQARYRGKTRIAVPEAYELVNVAIALTDSARQNPNLVATETPYHAELQTYFARWRDHPFVKSLDADMKRDQSRYFTLKMNAYAFEFDSKGRLVRSRVYDRTGFIGESENSLMPYFAEMRDFAAKTGFRKFYAAHKSLYQSQINYLNTEADVPGMLSWLRANFPGVKPYDTTNIIFSPLVSGMQSATWIESNGFRELQPHVNFPYPNWADPSLSAPSQAVQRGYILFTELNHGFINPTAERYAARINKALDNRAHWAVKGSSSDSYGNAESLFNEMMNWGLIGPYIIDHVQPAEQSKMLARLDRYMGARGRGFPQSPAFNAFLVELYRNRPPGTTVEALYPQIVEWFEKHDDSKPYVPEPVAKKS